MALRYAAIGDSIPRGFRLGMPRPGVGPEHGFRVRLGGVPLWWFDHPEDAYPRRLLRRLDGDGGTLCDLSASGLTSGDAWVGCGAASWLATPITSFRPELVTVTLGANDLRLRWSLYVPAIQITRRLPRSLRRRTLIGAVSGLAPGPRRFDHATRRLGRNLAGLLSWLLRVTEARIVVTTYYNGDGSAVVQRGFVEPVNATICETVGALDDRRLSVVRLDRVVAGHHSTRPASDRYISNRDGLHPTPAGHQAIADAIARHVGEYDSPGFGATFAAAPSGHDLA